LDQRAVHSRSGKSDVDVLRCSRKSIFIPDAPDTNGNTKRLSSRNGGVRFDYDDEDEDEKCARSG
jgi:hypothetical protein